MDFSLFEDLLKFVPFALALGIGVFWMDRLFYNPVVKMQRQSRSFCGYQASDRFAFSDPDGRDNRESPRA